MTPEEWNAIGPIAIAIAIALFGAIVQVWQAHLTNKRLKEQAQEQMQAEATRRDWESEQQAIARSSATLDELERIRKEQLRQDSAELLSVAGEAMHTLREVSDALGNFARQGKWDELWMAIAPWDDRDIARRLAMATGKMHLHGAPIRLASDRLQWDLLLEYKRMLTQFENHAHTEMTLMASHSLSDKLATLCDRIADELWGAGIADATSPATDS